MPFEQQKIESNPSKILSDFLKYVLFLFVLKVLICFDATRNVKNTKSFTKLFFFLKSHLEFSPKKALVKSGARSGNDQIVFFPRKIYLLSRNSTCFLIRSSPAPHPNTNSLNFLI